MLFKWWKMWKMWNSSRSSSASVCLQILPSPFLCYMFNVSFIYDTFIIDHHSIISTFFLALGLICLSAYSLWFLVTKPRATVSTHWSFCAEVLLGVNPVGIWLKQTLHSGKRCGIHATPCRIETFRLSSFFPMLDYRSSTCQNQA